MSSPEPHKQNLIPAGLPLAYVGSYAVVGLASLAYISVMMSGPGRATLDIAAPDRFAQSTEAEPPQVIASTETTDTRQPEAEARFDDTTAVANDAAPSVSPATQQQAELIEPAPPSPNIETKYVTTEQIIASRPGRTPDAQSVVAAVTPPPNPVADPSATSNIVTGSIAVPPPPERAPPPPAVIRAALKPAVAPARAAAANPPPQRPVAKPAAPIDFGPAVVTEAKAQPEAAPALAVLLATGSSVESLRLTWNLLQERHAAALLDLSPRYIVETNPGAPDRSFALLAGPVVSATGVARVCSALVSEGLTCRTRPFGGNSL
ncbi:MAG: hypothetical protein KJ587_13030 [Alphaproteobacteria bacterium]|nr:hypothetical protein [Alphaproteobacteria bacterium]